MVKNLFIGVDGGGTKTKVLIQDEEGQVIGKARSGPANISTSSQFAWQSILGGINSALSQINSSVEDPNYQLHVGLALAGALEDEHAHQQFLAHPNPFATILLTSDALAACVGAHDNQDGAIMIAGTGVKGCQCFRGDVQYVCGYGFPHADEGAGAWLGCEALRYTFKVVDGRAKPNKLSNMILAMFEKDQKRLDEWAIAATPNEYGSLAPYVVKCAAEGDIFSNRLMLLAAQEIEDAVEALEAKCGFAQLPLCFFGGVAPFIIPHLSDKTKERIVERKHSATEGALLLAKEKFYATKQSKEDLCA